VLADQRTLTKTYLYTVKTKTSCFLSEKDLRAMNDGPTIEPKKANALRVARAVFWSFFGVRKGRDHDTDAVTITPLQAIIGGLIGTALFVLTLLLIVKQITG